MIDVSDDQNRIIFEGESYKARSNNTTLGDCVLCDFKGRVEVCAAVPCTIERKDKRPVYFKKIKVVIV